MNHFALHWAKKLAGAATISVGSVGLSGEFVASFMGESSQPASLVNLIHRLEIEEFDLIAVGRAQLNDPEWVSKIKKEDTQNPKDFSTAKLSTVLAASSQAWDWLICVVLCSDILIYLQNVSHNGR